MARDDIRLALPSKGRLASDALAFLEACGLKVDRGNHSGTARIDGDVPATGGYRGECTPG